MLTLNILGGPTRREALCPTCVYSVMQKGSNGEELISCCLGGGVRELKFVVCECTAYTDRRILKPERTVGFVRSAQPKRHRVTVIKIAWRSCRSRLLNTKLFCSETSFLSDGKSSASRAEWKETMTAIYVKNGTPSESHSKCATCQHAHILRGFRESEEAVYCTFSYDRLLVVPFKVYECSSYMDRTRPTWKQMEDLAIDILPLSSTSAKPAGFRTHKDTNSDEETSDEFEAEPVGH